MPRSDSPFTAELRRDRGRQRWLVVSGHPVIGEKRGAPIAARWKRLRAKLRDLNPQLRLGLRVTTAAVAAFMLAQIFTAPLAGLWAVLTAIFVTQISVGASVKATILCGYPRRGGVRCRSRHSDSA